MSNKPSFVAYPPRWHAGIAVIGAAVAGLVFIWSSLDGEVVGIVIGATLFPTGVYATLDAMTTQFWVSGNCFHLKDRIFRVRTFNFVDIQSISFVPGELFFVDLTDGRRIRFPAGSKNLAQLSDILRKGATH